MDHHQKKYNNHDIYRKPLFLLAFFIIKASKNTVRLLYLFHFFIIYQLRRANNKTTTTSSKIFIRSEISRARRPVMLRTAGKDPQRLMSSHGLEPAVIPALTWCVTVLSASLPRISVNAVSTAASICFSRVDLICVLTAMVTASDLRAFFHHAVGDNIFHIRHFSLLLMDEAFQPLGYFHEVYQFLASGYVFGMC